MRYGFKKRAEDLAIAQRTLLSCRSIDPLPARILSKHLQVTIVTPSEIPHFAGVHLDQLLEVDPQSWSATTIVRKNKVVIIHNPKHTIRRQESNLMHELAHLILKHRPSHIVEVGQLPFALRTYDPEQEEEATWLGGCLQIPRSALVWAVKRNMSEQKIADHFGSSVELAKYRLQVTGVSKLAV